MRREVKRQKYIDADIEILILNYRYIALKNIDWKYQYCAKKISNIRYIDILSTSLHHCFRLVPLAGHTRRDFPAVFSVAFQVGGLNCMLVVHVYERFIPSRFSWQTSTAWQNSCSTLTCSFCPQIKPTGRNWKNWKILLLSTHGEVSPRSSSVAFQVCGFNCMLVVHVYDRFTVTVLVTNFNRVTKQLFNINVQFLSADKTDRSKLKKLKCHLTISTHVSWVKYSLKNL